VGSPAVAELDGTLASVAGLEEPSPVLARLLGHLQETVARYVAGRRTEGAPIERVLPEVRCVVREAESAEGPFGASEALMGQVVRWVIAAYQDRPDPRQESPSASRTD
jgi:hypothetical protein